MKKCPCHSGKNYTDCCQPLHQGAPAPTALALMRSRYAAYALGLVDYVIKTQRPENREGQQELARFCRETEFRGLEILEAGEKTVTFRAILFQNGKDCSFTEKSLFEKIGSTWVFIAPSSTA